MSVAGRAVPRVRTGQFVGIALVAVVLAVALGVAGLLMISQGGVLLALGGVLLLLADGCAVGYLVLFLRTPRGSPQVVEREGATVLPEAAWARITAWGTLAASLGFLGAFVASTFTGGPTGGPGLGVLASVLVLLLSIPTVIGLLNRRIRRGELVLTPQGVTLSSWNAERSIAWDDVEEVVLIASPRRTLVVYAEDRSQVGLGRRPAGYGEQQARAIPGAERAVAVSFPHLTGDPGVVAAALEHWRRVRSARAELGTPAARLRLAPEERPT